MTPEERADFDELRDAVKVLMNLIELQEKNLSAKQRDLEAKGKQLDTMLGHLNVVTNQSSALGVLMIALQNAFTAVDPQHRALFTSNLVHARSDFEGRLLFTTVSDSAVEQFDEALKRLVDPDLHSLLQ